MKLPLSELLDRWSIELRKDYYGHGNRQLLEMVAAEIRENLSRSMAAPTEMFAIVRTAVLLGLRNADIANLEWQIRTKATMPLEEIGRRAVITRKLNDSRCEAKQELSKDLGENVEARHFGYGAEEAHRFTLDVQEPTDTNRETGSGSQAVRHDPGDGSSLLQRHIGQQSIR